MEFVAFRTVFLQGLIEIRRRSGWRTSHCKCPRATGGWWKAQTFFLKHSDPLLFPALLLWSFTCFYLTISPFQPLEICARNLASQTSKMEIICYPFVHYRILFKTNYFFKAVKVHGLSKHQSNKEMSKDLLGKSGYLLVSLGLYFRNIWLLLGFVMVTEILSRFSAPTPVSPSRTEQFPACSFYKCVSCIFFISFRWLFHILQIISGIMNWKFNRKSWREITRTATNPLKQNQPGRGTGWGIKSARF